MKKHLPSVILAVVLLLLWQGIAMIIDAAYILPSPTQICVRLWELREPLFLVHLPATMKVTAIGLLISIVLGILLAVVMDANEKVERALYPVIVASQTIPTTAIAPLFILWFGYSIWSKVLVTILITFFPIAITVFDGFKATKREMEELLQTYGAILWFGYSIWSKVLVTILITFFPIAITVFDGFKATKREMEELLQTYGATKADIFWKLKLPTALPNFFSAIKMAIPLSVIGAAIAEWLGAQEGLGYFSKRMMTQLDGAGVFAPVVLLSITAMLAVGIITVLEYRFIKWRKEI